MTFSLTPQQVESYNQDGYIIIPGFVNQQAVEKLHKIALEDQMISKNSFDLNDQSGKKTKLALWYIPGDDVYGLLTRSESIVNIADKLLDGDAAVCHYHSKLMQKEPRVGGAWEWHQDYGYWYKNGYLFPDQMISIMIAITEAKKENGCLQVIKGSHKMGRVEHGFAGEQVGASQQHVDLALEKLDLVYVEIKPGDALVFHPNLLHRSEANLSDKSRWSIISVYNRQTNASYLNDAPSSTIPVSVVPDDALLKENAAGFQDDSAAFLDKAKEPSINIK